MLYSPPGISVIRRLDGVTRAFRILGLAWINVAVNLKVSGAAISAQRPVFLGGIFGFNLLSVSTITVTCS